jgi:hypothetical protein
MWKGFKSYTKFDNNMAMEAVLVLHGLIHAYKIMPGNKTESRCRNRK